MNKKCIHQVGPAICSRHCVGTRGWRGSVRCSTLIAWVARKRNGHRCRRKHSTIRRTQRRWSWWKENKEMSQRSDGSLWCFRKLRWTLSRFNYFWRFPRTTDYNSLEFLLAWNFEAETKRCLPFLTLIGAIALRIADLIVIAFSHMPVKEQPVRGRHGDSRRGW